MRENPQVSSKVVSQAILSEKIAILDTLNGWHHIASSDGYLGWVPTNAIITRDTYLHNVCVNRLMAHLYEIDDTEYGPLMTLPYGTKLQAEEMENDRWLNVLLPCGKKGFIQSGDVSFEGKLFTKEELIDFSLRFLNLPYTWGGRSSFGFDCSGFVQMLYERLGIQLQRDSVQQMTDTRFLEVPCSNLAPCDLIFFGRSQDKITHVGMSLDKDRFIHATSGENQPWIRISHLSEKAWSGAPSSLLPFRQACSLPLNMIKIAHEHL